jgi:hypothetical protein
MLQSVVCMILVTAIMLGGGSACGKQEDAGGRPYSVDMVRAVFKQETGDELIIERSTHGNPVLGDVTLLGVAPGLDAKYGDFGITVYRRLGKPKRRLLDGGRRPDKNGIIWRYYAINEENHVPTWSAAKYYGNVRLIWIHKTKETNYQWDELDGALKRLVLRR